jgi:hypothetical protein
MEHQNKTIRSNDSFKMNENQIYFVVPIILSDLNHFPNQLIDIFIVCSVC